jgi:uncharacterized protein
MKPTDTGLAVAEYREGLRAGELRLRRCRCCEAVWLPPSDLCPQCLSQDLDWTLSQGQGVVTAHCQFHRAYYNEAAFPLPYTVLLVELDEGPRVYANPVEPSALLPVGARVAARVATSSAGEPVLRFTVAG